MSPPWPKPCKRRPGTSVELAYVDQGYTGADAEIAAADEGIDLEVVRLPEAKTRLRAAAAALGGGAFVRLGGAVPPIGEGLRAADRDAGGDALRRLQPPDAPQGSTAFPLEFITRSRKRPPEESRRTIT